MRLIDADDFKKFLQALRKANSMNRDDREQEESLSRK